MIGPFFNWLDERTGLVTAFHKFTHWTVPASLCLCRFLPVAIVTAFILQGITGLFLWAFYAPSSQTAWESVYYIQYQVPFGWLVRGIHHYSAQSLVGMLAAYVLLLIVHGAYRRPREFVYWSAVVMFLLSLCSCLTGDLLNWSLSGYFATIARVSFLQLLPGIGLPLYQLVVGGPDPQFGTLTLTRFTVLHIAVFGGGGFAVLCFWKWCDIRSRALFCAKGIERSCALACAKKKQRTFWGWEALFAGFFALLTLAGILALVFQHSYSADQIASRAETLPAEAYLGADLTSPADPGGSYDAARPEWSFRGLYYYSKLPIFSKIGMVFAIFVIPGCLVAYFMLLPILGRSWFLHCLIVPTVLALFGVYCWFTYQSYYEDYRDPEHSPTFLNATAGADVLKQRAVELCAAPTGIPQAGALSLLKSDAFVQGPKLFAQHCVSCHRFEPFGDVPLSSDFAKIECTDPSAPNLYHAVSPEWMTGYMDAEKLVSDDYFGKTDHFAVNGSMITYMNGRVRGGMPMDDGSFMLNTSDGLVASVISPDASPAFDILEAAFTYLVAEEANTEQIAKGEYLPLLKECLTAKFNDAEFIASLELKLPKAVLDALQIVLLEMLDDEKYMELLKDEDNIALITDDDIESFLTDTYLATLCGNEEPIPADEMKYIEKLNSAIKATVASISSVLYAESQLDAPRIEKDGQFEGLAPNAVADMNFLTCTECHSFYGVEKDHACDLRGYMSKTWLRGIIADPASPTYYGKENDRMPSYRPAHGDALLSDAEIGLLVDWMHGQWYRAPKVENDTLLGANGALIPAEWSCCGSADAAKTTAENTVDAQTETVTATVTATENKAAEGTVDAQAETEKTNE